MELPILDAPSISSRINSKTDNSDTKDHLTKNAFLSPHMYSNRIFLFMSSYVSLRADILHTRDVLSYAKKALRSANEYLVNHDMKI